MDRPHDKNGARVFSAPSDGVCSHSFHAEYLQSHHSTRMFKYLTCAKVQAVTFRSSDNPSQLTRFLTRVQPTWKSDRMVRKDLGQEMGTPITAAAAAPLPSTIEAPNSQKPGHPSFRRSVTMSC